MDPFTQKRLLRFVEEFRTQAGQCPTIIDFEKAGFDRKLVDLATKQKVLEQFYVTLTNGVIVKTYKVFQPF